MTGAILRGSATRGYRSTTPLDCPHCGKPVALSGQAAQDRQGPHLALWPVAQRPTDYTDSDMDRIQRGPAQGPATTGVAMPVAPGSVELIDDPVPTFAEGT